MLLMLLCGTDGWRRNIVNEEDAPAQSTHRHLSDRSGWQEALQHGEKRSQSNGKYDAHEERDQTLSWPSKEGHAGSGSARRSYGKKRSQSNGKCDAHEERDQTLSWPSKEGHAGSGSARRSFSPRILVHVITGSQKW